MYRLKAILAVLSLATTASAATLQQLSLDQISQSATAIVRARVTGSTASFTGSTIYTHYKLQITETWKGFPSNELMLPGGTAAGYKQSVPGVPRLETGAEYVMFLWTSSTGITHLIGLTQGLYNVNQQADGSLLASRPRIGETMLDAAGAKVNDQAVSMPLNAMKLRVSRTSRAGASK